MRARAQHVQAGAGRLGLPAARRLPARMQSQGMHDGPTTSADLDPDLRDEQEHDHNAVQWNGIN